MYLLLKITLLLGWASFASCSAEQQAWRASLLCLLSSSGFDSASSWNKPELNPLLAQQHRFTATSLEKKTAVVASLALAEWLLARKHPSLLKPFTATNFTVSSIYTGVAIHNLKVSSYASKR